MLKPLFKAVAQVAPIVGISVGDPNDRDTWRIDFAEGVTDEEKAAAQAMLASFDVPPPVPVAVSDRQFLQALAQLGSITQEEALAAVKTGALPAAMRAYVDALPDAEEKFAAEMILSGSIEFRRDHPLVATFAAINGWTDKQVDDLWRLANSL